MKFYPDGRFIPLKLPEHFRKSVSKQACGNCGMYSNRRSFCGIYKTDGVRDNFVCNSWRQRHFQR